MFFFFRKKPIYVEFYTTDPSVYQYSRPDHASKFIPDWLKNTKGILTEGIAPFPTIKRCPGLLDTYKKGLIKPMWHDLAIEVDANQKVYNWQGAEGFTPNITSHSTRQWETFVNPEEYTHMKLNSPWLIKTKENVQWQTMPCFWNDRLQSNYQVVPGILDTKYVHNMNINIFMNYNPSRRFLINHGTPIEHYLPLTERPIKTKYYLVDQKEFDMLDTYKPMFIGPHNSKVADDRKKSKCPFSF